MNGDDGAITAQIVLCLPRSFPLRERRLYGMISIAEIEFESAGKKKLALWVASKFMKKIDGEISCI